MARDIKKEKREAALAKAIAMLAESGVDTSTMKATVDTDFREEIAVATVVHHPEAFQVRRCKTCKRAFGHNHIIPHGSKVGFCSNLCAREDWVKSTGLAWNRISTRDPWDDDPPLIITPEQFENLRRLTDWFNRNREALANADRPKTTQVVEWEPEEVPEDQGQDQFPTSEQVPSAEHQSTFDIFAEPQLDQGDTHTTPDAWIFQ